MKLNFKEWKKVDEQKDHSIFRNKDGHELKVAHKGLHPATRGQLASLPLAKGGEAKGGKVDKSSEFQYEEGTGSQYEPPTDVKDASQEELDAQHEQNMQYAKGGEVDEFQESMKSRTGGKPYDDSIQQSVDPMDIAMVAAPLARTAMGAAKAAAPAAKALMADEAGVLRLPGASARGAANVAEASNVQNGAKTARGVQDSTQRLGREVTDANRNSMKGDKAYKASKKPWEYADGGQVNNYAEGTPDAPVEEKPLEIEPVGNQEQAPLEVEAIPPNPQAVAQQVAFTQGANPGMPPGAAEAKTLLAQPQAAPQASIAPAATEQQVSDNPLGQAAVTAKQAFDTGMASQMQGLAGDAATQHKQMVAQAAEEGKQAALQQRQMSQFKIDNWELEEHRKQIQDAIADHKIDPDRYVKNMSTGSKIMSALGMIVSGFGAGLGKTSNLASDYLNRQIENDIESQKSQLGSQKTLLEANLKQYQNMRDAAAMTSIQQKDILASKLQQLAATAGSSQASNNYLKAAGDLMMKSHQELGQMNMRISLLNGAAKQGSDPAMLVPVLVTDPSERKEVFNEIKRAQDTRRMADHIMSSFDQAVKENTVLRTGAGMLRTPGSVGALHQHLQPTFADLEGTVRQSAMDNTFDNITPKPGDSQHKIDQKREALRTYLESKKSAPVAKGHGIDLDKFQSTQAMQAAPEIKTMGGKKFQKTNGGWIEVK